MFIRKSKYNEIKQMMNYLMDRYETTMNLASEFITTLLEQNEITRQEMILNWREQND